jgi:cytochrome c551/c552
VIVTPNYCARCHGAEVKQFEKSHHAAAAKFIGSLDNMLGKLSREARQRTMVAANAMAAK